MKTYQDLLNAENVQKFIFDVISEYKASEFYSWAMDGERYSRQKNTTIMNYQKLLYTMTGATVPDNYSANHKCASNFFDRFITQENQYLLGNGVVFENENTKEKLGGNNFDTILQKMGKWSLAHGVSYGFFNLNKVKPFSALEFIPLYDEEDGSIKAGVRWWQIASDKPIRATLYEMDGYTEYKKTGDSIVVLVEKRPYKEIIATSVADGSEIIDGGNYPSFPIVPLWGNPYHQSELVGIKSQIDAYDLIKSGFANDLDDASMIYWTIQNAGGMEDVDLAKFIERMKTVKAVAVTEDGARAEAHTLDIPYQSRESYLTRLEIDLYNDAMALNTQGISAGNVTATAINASYEALNNKTDQFEYCVDEFIQGLLTLIGVEDDATFKRSKIINQTEETTMILACAEYLDKETILKHLPFLTPEEINGVIERTEAEEQERFALMQQMQMMQNAGTEEPPKGDEE